jgi:16S rRNA processing protein RimM
VIEREQLPKIDKPGSFYWADLVGLRVETIDGDDLGRIEQLFETGSNDVMVLAGERERLVPYIWQQVVKQVDLDAGVMRVDWDPEF